MKETILVIGATGMLGKPVAYRLKADGYNVRVLSRSFERAQKIFDSSFEIAVGDVGIPNTLEAALKGCYGVHINLAGGPQPEDFDRIEHLGTVNIVKAAAKTGVQRITFLSGASVNEENAWFYGAKAKLQAEKAIIAGNIPYTIFRASWFMESLPRFVQGKRASIIGKQPNPVHWVAAEDYAGMVSGSFNNTQAVNKILYIYGPEAIPMLDALKTYCTVLHPDLKASVAPVWLTALIAGLTRNRQLKHISKFMGYIAKISENGNPREAYEILGTPVTTLRQWCAEQKTGSG